MLAFPAGKAAIADEVARQAAEQERMGRFVPERVAARAPLPGAYPPQRRTQAAYASWCDRQG